MDLAFAADGQNQLFGQGIDYRDPDTVQTTGDLVRVVVKFAAGVQHGHDYFRGGIALLVLSRGNAPAIVDHRYRLVRMDGNGNLLTMPRQRLIDGVVHQFEYHVVQAGAVIGIADVHAGPPAHGIEPLEDLDAGGIVILLSYIHPVLFRSVVSCSLRPSAHDNRSTVPCFT